MRTIWFTTALALLSISCVQDIDDISPPEINKEEATYFWQSKEKVTIYPTESCFKIYRTKTEQEREQRERDYQTLECLDKNPLTYAIITTPELASTLSATDEQIYSIPTYVTEQGEEIIFSERVIVSLESENDIDKLKTVTAQYNIKIVNKSDIRYWIECTCTNESAGTSLEIANKIYESKLFKNAFPGPVLSLTPFAADPLYTQQWGLHNTGQVISSQTMQYTATPTIDIGFDSVKHLIPLISDIKVAVIDNGVQNHPELIIGSFWDSFSRSPVQAIHTDPQYGSHHGTRCAGIIGAKRNNTGITGISSAKIMGISIKFNQSQSSNVYNDTAAALQYAVDNNADIISCSWGGDSPVAATFLEELLDHALTNGRNGLGCIVVFATGNSGMSSVSYPANADPRILAVGAITPNGQRATLQNSNFGSNFGAALDVVAPGIEIISTDSSSMYSPFSGTSAACPFVSGVAAALLSIDPTLTRQEVCDAIEVTARKLGNGYSNYTNRPNGKWHPEYGYGLVRIDEAISYIFPITNSTNLTIDTSATYRGSHMTFENVSIVDNAEVTVKSVFGDTTMTNVQQSSNSKVYIDSHTNLSLNGLSLENNAHFESVSAISTTIEELSMTQNTTAEITASNITINPGFEISQGCELTLKIN